MDSLESFELLKLKRKIRDQALADRHAQNDRTSRSRRICRRLAGLPQFVAAQTVMFYIDDGREVATREFFQEVLDVGKRIVIPYCVNGWIRLFRFVCFEDLVEGKYGILEPKAEFRRLAERSACVSELDLVIVPGVAFDATGGRIGRGKGYYDKLLEGVRTDALLVALAFESQLFQEIPILPHDVSMHAVITEDRVYSGRSL